VECLPPLTNAEIVEKASQEKVHWVVVGPEIPLAAGLAGRRIKNTFQERFFA
jgi:phosphoribosylamine-glycine ligase